MDTGAGKSVRADFGYRMFSGIVSLLLGEQGSKVKGIDIQPEAIEFAEGLLKMNILMLENALSLNVSILCYMKAM